MNQPSSDNVTFDDALEQCRHWLIALTCAVGAAQYVDAWLAAVQLRRALGKAERLAGVVASESWRCASDRLVIMLDCATPLLSLAPDPDREELLQMRVSHAHWEHAEQQWRSHLSHVVKRHF